MIQNSLLSLVLLVFLSFLPVCLCSSSSSDSDFPVSTASVIALNDATFEGKTQAATGQTSVIWFVDFYAPWCGHCKNLAPVWSRVAQRLSTQVIVASVDCTSSPVTAKRFGIRSYPTIKLFRNGKMYSYSGVRNEEELVEFALNGYETVQAEIVPGESSAFYVPSTEAMKEALLRVQKVIAEDPLTASVLLLIGMSIGFLFALLFFWAVFDRPTREQIERSKEIHKMLKEAKEKQTETNAQGESKKQQ
jgi:protein disulfide-isomerase-like protein